MSRRYPAVLVTCQSWLLTTQIDCDDRLFPTELWTAIERTHYMQSSKTFVMVDRPFWKDNDPTTGPRRHEHDAHRPADPRHLPLRQRPGQAGRHLPLLHLDARRPEVLPLDATSGSSSCWTALEQIYPDVDIGSHIIGDPITVSWEDEPYFLGAFKANLPGHYRYQRRMFTHFMQDRLPQAAWHLPRRRRHLLDRRLGRGRRTTALNAVWGVMNHLGGAPTRREPGPGRCDFFFRRAFPGGPGLAPGNAPRFPGPP